MGFVDFIREYKELITAVLTLITGVIGWLTAKAKQRRQIEITHRVDHGGGGGGGAGGRGGGGGGARSGPEAVRLAPSVWVYLQSVSVFMIVAGIIAGVWAWAVPQAAATVFYWVFGILMGLLLLAETPSFLWQKLAHVTWVADAHGLGVRRFGRDRRYAWSELAGLRLRGQNGLSATIGHESAGYAESIHFIPRALQARSAGLARAAGVPVTSSADKVKRR